MKADRMTARIAATLFIAATVASLLSTGFLNPVLNSSDYLGKTFAHQDRVIVGAFFLMLAAFASAGIAISLYPVLRRHAEELALGSACFRVMEGVLYLVSAIAALLLVTLSQEFAKAGRPAPSYFQATGTDLRALRCRRPAPPGSGCPGSTAPGRAHRRRTAPPSRREPAARAAASGPER